MRYGFFDQAHKIVLYSLLEAAEYFSGRLPELFCGLDRARYPVPVSYPASCSPQAWASAAPVQLIRTLLRFDPGLIWNELWLAPTLPSQNTHFHSAPPTATAPTINGYLRRDAKMAAFRPYRRPVRRGNRTLVGW